MEGRDTENRNEASHRCPKGCETRLVNWIYLNHMVYKLKKVRNTSDTSNFRNMQVIKGKYL